MITTDRMQEIMVKITLGQKVIGVNDEEKRFIENVKFDIDSIKTKGGIVEIPSEYPLLDD